MRFVLCFVFCLILIDSISAQFNLKVGYQFSYSDPTVLNSITTQLNENNNTLDNFQPMENLTTFYGFILGARYRFKPVAFYFDWSSKLQTKEFTGLNPTTQANNFREHFYKVNTNSLGLELFYNRFSIGGSIDLNSMRIRTENTERADRHTIFEDNNFGSTFHITYHLYGNEFLALAIQPYIQIPWTKFNLAPLEGDLDTGVDLQDFEEGFTSYGIRIVFQNGHFEK